MRIFKLSNTWLLAFVLGVFATGCGREQSGFIAPFVVSTNPANGAPAVPVTQVITATFNNVMNPTTLNTVTFTVAGPSGTPLPGTVAASGTTATFTPASNLAPSTKFTGTITTGAKDPAGNALASNFVWTFTTASIPTVTSTSPANGATGVPTNTKISATFSEAMNATTITLLTFTVTGPGTTPVAGAVAYSGASNTATFTPAANLAANTLFTATITTGAKSVPGNALAANFVWSFTTGAAPSTTAPRVIATIPFNGATNVPINQKVSATFSTAMDPATINGTTFTLTGPGTTPVTGTVALVGATAIFTPASNLAASTLFTATITTVAKDLAGNALASNFVWTFTTGTTASTTAPTITATNPVNGTTGVPLNKTVNATFSKAMDPTTITTATFTLTGPGTTPVAGTVAYAATTFIATFTPASNLLPNTIYIATVTTGAKDLFGNALASGVVPNPWTFTTGPPFIGAGPAPVNLGSAATFAILAGSTVTNTGPTIVNGDLGLSPGTAVTGFPPGIVNGAIRVPPDPTVAPAKLDLTAAFNDAAGRATNVIIVASGELGGLTLTPGLYRSGISSFAITSVDLTLDAQGDSNAVWIFQMPSSTLTVGNARQVVLAGGAKASNIYWAVGSSATIGTTAIFKGNILASQSITLQTGATLDGRALTQIAAVTLDTNIVTVPAP